ncbi:hypothetical protein [Nannocystis bainbridge]|uniref:Uncharacterized protein n=1 Tax=Nannocystis bainbridge TaxID=2995303 RepID=A0ABT5DUR7_9BACT|nr:hypothetical protein [Nannocystis bainbridge]MDC0716463.1 hypothetical protein [Nannocystis bainbridge]
MMFELRLRGLVCLLLVGCPEGRGDSVTAGEDGSFPCGDNGGHCDAATQLCIVGGSDRCSTCVPLPAACDEDATCGCVPPGTDPSYGASACEDAGVCEAEGDGRVLTCAEIAWGCG